MDPKKGSQELAAPLSQTGLAVGQAPPGTSLAPTEQPVPIDSYSPGV